MGDAELDRARVEEGLRQGVDRETLIWTELMRQQALGRRRRSGVRDPPETLEMVWEEMARYDALVEEWDRELMAARHRLGVQRLEEETGEEEGGETQASPRRGRSNSERATQAAQGGQGGETEVTDAGNSLGVGRPHTLTVEAADQRQRRTSTEAAQECQKRSGTLRKQFR